MRYAVVALALLASGCFSPNYGNGALMCAPNGACPPGLHCAGDNLCYKNGFDPDLSVPLDMSDSSDLAAVDDASADVDMALVTRQQGQACGGGAQCDSGLYCVDGYCCNSQCGNTCQACNVPGNLGFCTNVGAGQNPAGARSCNAQPATSCGRDGTCDGAGNCRDWPSGTHCSTGTCDVATGNFTNPSTCNGSGACVSNGGGNCAPYKCQDATQCYGMCTDGHECSGANQCVGGSCGPLPDGRACTTGAQCMNGNCVDGYCCNSACSGVASECQACDVPGSLGICTTVAAGLPHGTRSCTNQGMSPCGGRCDGSTAACFYAPSTMSCGQTCSAGQLIKSACDGAGACTPSAAMTCTGNYACPTGGSACLTMCAANADCFPTTTYGCATDKTCANYCVYDTDNFDDGCIYAQ